MSATGASIDLRRRAEAEAAALPALVLAAERLAAVVSPGAHGLRRAGPGEEFWQYRPAQPGEPARAIDWRRSARSDATFVRDRERQTPQAAVLWVSAGPGMRFTGAAARPSKRDRAMLLVLALAAALLRGGERVALLGQPPRTGRSELSRLADGLFARAASDETDDAPDPALLRPNQRAVLLGDFLGDPAGIERFLDHAAATGVTGLILQVLDPDELEFPFTGAILFRGAGGRLAHDTRDAAGLRAAYLQRLHARQALLTAAAARAGWQFGSASTGSAPAEALLWLATALRG